VVLPVPLVIIKIFQHCIIARKEWLIKGKKDLVPLFGSVFTDERRGTDTLGSHAKLFNFVVKPITIALYTMLLRFNPRNLIVSC
jgi:hypothetical protein